jgi:hypothetical protein
VEFFELQVSYVDVINWDVYRGCSRGATAHDTKILGAPFYFILLSACVCACMHALACACVGASTERTILCIEKLYTYNFNYDIDKSHHRDFINLIKI